MDLIEVSENTNRHPWELSRKDCIFKEIKKIKNINNVLDIGCGDGYFDKELLKAQPRIKELYGVDIFLEESYSDGKGNWTNSLENLPNKKFDLILMMDVLEHIENDNDYMKNIQNRLSDDGVILLTVPAFMKLYSLHDEELKHFRRYNMKMLKEALKSTDLKIHNKSYFYLSLIILRLITMNKTQNLSMWNDSEKSFKTKFVRGVLNIDYAVLRAFSKLHIYIGGLSLLAVIKKDNGNAKKDNKSLK